MSDEQYWKLLARDSKDKSISGYYKDALTDNVQADQHI